MISTAKKPRILIVDDDKQNLISISGALNHLDADIDTTTKAKEAIYMINNQAYALLIFDVQMPEMDGYQLAEIIQSGYQNNKTPIIFISGVFFDEFSIFKGYRSGAVDYLTKPLNMEILQSKVKVFLELDKARAEIEIERAKTFKALEEKTLFIAKVSHEIRNPLGVIISIISLMEEGVSQKDTDDYLQILKSSSDQMSRLLNDLVDYTQIEVGNITLEKSYFNIKNEIALLIKAFEIQTKLSKNQFSFSIDKMIPDHLIGDITRYKQIIYNLLGNANKFTSKGQIHLDVKKMSSTTDSIFISTEIHDNGIGMSKEEQIELFKPFSQSNQSITRKYGGSGLGLAIAKKLSALLGGDIQLKSEKGKGTSFVFTAKFGI